MSKRALVGSVPFFVLAALGVRVSAQVTYFATDPWSFRQQDNTSAVAVGDVNRDGHLDVVFGNVSQENTLFLGIDGFFDTTTPAWSSDATLRTHSLALGDVDGDGDLDLVCGNFSGPNHLYLNNFNTGGTFELSAWEGDPPSSNINYTNSVVLADVDGDGDLDLVCGNGAPLVPQKNVAYRNVGGPAVFETTPFWISQDQIDTEGIAVGDVDGDGRLDLVCGNGITVTTGGETRGIANTLYLGAAGGGIETKPAWRSTETNVTAAVALGDTDGDGDLDLVCGNGLEYESQLNTLYENIGGELDTIPGWRSDGALTRTTSVALGDVDGDGDLDVVFGNYRQENQLYVNDGAGGLSEAWTSTEDRSPTRAVVLADADGDGDLDQITGNEDTENSIYENATPLFGNTFDRIADEALGFGGLRDVNGDGYVDAVFDLNQTIKLFLNENGTIESTADWELSGWVPRQLADFDGNGRADLFVYTYTPPFYSFRLHADSADVFAHHPAWEDGADDTVNDRRIIYSFLAGDLNGDGATDLLLGGWGDPGGDHLLYVNSRDSSVFRKKSYFPYDVDWCASEDDRGWPVAFGDIDGDGDLDVAIRPFDLRTCEGRDQLLLNRRDGTIQISFEAFPKWNSEPHETREIDFGDVNGDGRLDLVANTSLGIRFYLNDRQAVVPDGTADDPKSLIGGDPLRLLDLDGDGDIDLATLGGYWLNEGGGFETSTPDDRQDWPRGLSQLNLADLDRDGDVDLIGHRTEAPMTVAVYGRKQPPFKGDPTDPTGQVPNSPVGLREVTVTQPDTNTLRVELVAIDVESDPVYVVADYQFAGEPTFFPVEVDGFAGEPIGPLATSRSGTTHSFDWDLSRFPLDGRDVVLRLRAVEIPKGVSQIQYVARHIHRVGKITPTRPEIVPPGEVGFGTVTVGDTVCTDLVVSNRGNEVLHVNSVDLPLPSPEMTIDYPVPFDVLPRGEATIRLCLAPCPQTSVEGDIVIASTDPLSPEVTLAVSTDIRPLEIRSELLFNPDTLILGDPVTVIVTPEPDVRFEHGYLFYRAHGSAVFGDSIALEITSSGLGFIGTIPGESVTEAGLDYYVRVENDCAVTTDPPGAPGDSVFYRVVEAPVAIAPVPIPPFEEGREIRVVIGLPEGAEFVSGAVHYRAGGGGVYRSGSIESGEGLYFATIPDSTVGPRGVDYWVDVRTLTTTLTDPPADPERHPHSIPVIVQNLTEPSQHAGEQYRLLSIPLNMQGDALESLSNELLVKFGVNDTKWRCFTHVGGIDKYVEFKGDSTGTFGFEQGQAYWLITREPHRIDTGPDQGETALTDRPFEITLEAGPNLIGNPFNFPVDWASMEVDTLALPDAVRDGKVEYPVGVVGGLYDHDRYDVDHPRPAMAPFDGYWVLTQQPVVLRIPPVEAVQTGASVSDEAVAGKAMTPGDWSVKIIAHSGAVTGQSAVVGIRSGATAKWDRFDRSMVPSPPGEQMAVYLPHGGWTRPGPFAVDLRGGYEEGDDGTVWGQVWAFDVAKSYAKATAGDEVVLSLEGLDEVRPDAMIHLIDRRLERVVDMRKENRYAYYQGTRTVVTNEDEVRFVLLVGSEAYVTEKASQLAPRPTVTTLHQNYPNPFNPSTIIRYDLATPGRVRLRVYDVSGALVKVLEDRDRTPGRYEIGWNGENDQGDQVASGVYFYRLTAQNFSKTRKMIFIK